MRKIKKHDEVIVLTGKDKGRRGKVLRIINDGQKVIVESINMVKKHVRPNPNTNEQGGIKEKEAFLHISNVAMYDPATKKAGKVGIKTLDDGRKVRYFKSTDEVIDI